MKANTRNQRAMGLRRLTVVGATLAVLVTSACGSTEAAKPSAGGATSAAAVAVPAVFAADKYLSNPGDFIDPVKDTWEAAKTVVKVELKDDMSFSPKDISLEAGKPYQIDLVNTGKTKHEFTADKFFRSAATRKIDNAGAEVKAPFFTEVEVMAGKTVTLFLIPITPGSYDTLCEIPGHEGMEGTITVTGTKPAAPVEKLETLEPGWAKNAALVKTATDTWDAKAQTRKIEAGEDGAGKMFFKEKNTVMKVGVPVKLSLVNVTKTDIKHEWSSKEFFPTLAFRKAEDTFGEYKTPLLFEAEVKHSGSLDLFFIPTQVGEFPIECALPGHKTLGMFGTITVTK